MLSIKILFTINSLKKRKNYSFKTLFTIPVQLKSTYFSLKRVTLTKKNSFELKKHFISIEKKKKANNNNNNNNIYTGGDLTLSGYRNGPVKNIIKT